jgi:hypothetical protein
LPPELASGPLEDATLLLAGLADGVRVRVARGLAGGRFFFGVPEIVFFGVGVAESDVLGGVGAGTVGAGMSRHENESVTTATAAAPDNAARRTARMGAQRSDLVEPPAAGLSPLLFAGSWVVGFAVALLFAGPWVVEFAASAADGVRATVSDSVARRRAGAPPIAAEAAAAIAEADG